MSVTDTLARIDYALMVESNAAGAEWLLDEFDRGFEAYENGHRPRPHIRPMIELLDEHGICPCDTPEEPDWSWSSDAYHSSGDVVCRQCERTVHELDARCVFCLNGRSRYWVCLDCQPLPSLLDEEAS